MIKGIGTDLVKIERLQEKHLKKILTTPEIMLYESFSSETRKQEFLAGRFALKEAIIKAVTTPELVIQFQDITILPNEFGKPLVTCEKLPHLIFHVSLAHERDYAIGFCVVESKEI